jgi:hypothetical protein
VVVSLRHKLLVIHQTTTLVEETNHCRGEAEVHVLGIGQIFLLEVCPFTSIVRVLSFSGERIEGGLDFWSGKMKFLLHGDRCT